MPTTFDRLDEVRSTVRAKCVEDRDYFVERVFGAHALPQDYEDLWYKVVHGLRVDGHSVSETFEWLFPELVTRAA